MTTTVALIALAAVVGFLWMWVAYIARNLPRAFDAFGKVVDGHGEKIQRLQEDLEDLEQQVQELRRLTERVDPPGGGLRRDYSADG